MGSAADVEIKHAAASSQAGAECSLPQKRVSLLSTQPKSYPAVSADRWGLFPKRCGLIELSFPCSGNSNASQGCSALIAAFTQTEANKTVDSLWSEVLMSADLGGHYVSGK